MELQGKRLYTPQHMRVAYGLDALIAQDFTSKGPTVVVMGSCWSPTLQQDMDIFDSHYQLPATTVQVLVPLGYAAFDTTNKCMVEWAHESEEDVETIHALAPGAHIVLSIAPDICTEGTAGAPDFHDILAANDDENGRSSSLCGVQRWHWLGRHHRPVLAQRASHP